MSEARTELLAQLRAACERANWNGRPSKADGERIARIERDLRALRAA